jgi:nucleoside-diphosphate kinase
LFNNLIKKLRLAFFVFFKIIARNGKRIYNKKTIKKRGRNMKATRTAVLVKPDGLQRGLIGEIISRFERKGLKLVGLKMLRMADDQLDKWYSEHREKEFFTDLKSFMGSMPIVAMVWEGIDAVPVVRLLVGTTLGREAEGGSIRGDFGMSQQMNLIHASSSNEDAQREIAIVFNDDELFHYHGVTEAVVYAEGEAEFDENGD